MLIVSKWLDVGGAERFVSNMAQGIDPERFDIRVCLFRDIRGYPVPAGIPIDVLMGGTRHRHWHLPMLCFRLARTIDAIRPDVVLSAYSYPNAVTGVAMRIARAKPKWVARVSSNLNREEGGWRRLVMRWLYRRADHFIVNSSRLGHALGKIYRFADRRWTYLPNAVHQDVVSRAPVGEHDRMPRLVSIGRLAPQKRLDVLLEAVQQVAQMQPVEVMICGSGAMREELETIVEALGLEEIVSFEGFVDPFAALARSDLFVLSSDHEGSPNALLEAQAMGVPVISTNCDYGPAELIEHGLTGLLVPTGDPSALATAIAWSLQHPSEMAAMANTALWRVRREMLIPHVSRDLEGILEGVLREAED